MARQHGLYNVLGFPFLFGSYQGRKLLRKMFYLTRNCSTWKGGLFGAKKRATVQGEGTAPPEIRINMQPKK